MPRLPLLFKYHELYNILYFVSSFAQWRYHRQWGLSETWLLQVIPVHYRCYGTIAHWSLWHSASFYRCNIQLYSIYYNILLIKYNFHYSCLAKYDLSIETTRVYSFGKMMHVTFMYSRQIHYLSRLTYVTLTKNVFVYL